MVDVQKVKVMTWLAAFEQRESDRALKIVKYYRRDYVCMELLKSLMCCTIGYGLLVLCLGFYQMEYLLGNAMQLDYVSIIEKLFAGYIAIIVCNCVIGIFSYNAKFSKAKRKVKEYDKTLHLLRQLYRQEQEKNEERITPIR